MVTVARKEESVAEDQRIPEEVGGFAVGVREASPAERLRAQDPQRFAQIATGGRART